MNQGYVIGTFVREEKNRFLCIVDIEGINEECYIPSSCRLENFLELTGKTVILHKNMNKEARTKYALYAIRFKRNYILLRTAEANDIIFNNISKRRFSYLGKRNIVEKERKVDDYKSDIFLPETNTIIEIKSIISTSKDAEFPTVYSERAIEQLMKIKYLLAKGYKVVYIYVSLNPYVRQISLSNDKHFLDYSRLFNECMKRGMLCKAYSTEIKDGIVGIRRGIDVATNN